MTSNYCVHRSLCELGMANQTAPESGLENIARSVVMETKKGSTVLFPVSYHERVQATHWTTVTALHAAVP